MNELRLTYTRVRDHRGATRSSSRRSRRSRSCSRAARRWSPGTENFSGRNELDQDIIEINDAFTLLKGQHVITIGTHNEFLK